MTNMVKVCPDCGVSNEFFEAFCVSCQRDLSVVLPFDEDLLNVALVPVQIKQIVLMNLDLVTGQPTNQFVAIPDGAGSYIVGRDFGDDEPNINIKAFSVPYVSNDPTSDKYKQRQRGISREHAVIVRRFNELFIYRSPKANPDVSLKVEKQEVTGMTEAEAVPLYDQDVIALGDIFIPGTKNKAPGVIVQVNYL
jgi:hypothetical protein